MNEDRTRTFEGNYTSNDNKKHHFKVRIYKRLAVFGLSIVLLRTGVAVMEGIDAREATAKADFGKDILIDDKALVAKIVDENPNMLFDVSDLPYTVKEGDDLQEIATNFGTTVERLCYLNDMKPTSTLYNGGVLKVERIRPKSDEEQTLVALESYFYDYVFKSPVCQTALSTKPIRDSQAEYYRSLIFGHPKTATDVDTNSIYGKYITAYIAYHKGDRERSPEDTHEYIKKLADLAVQTEEDLNLHGATTAILPFEQYKTMLQDGKTKKKAEIGMS